MKKQFFSSKPKIPVIAVLSLECTSTNVCSVNNKYFVVGVHQFISLTSYRSWGYTSHKLHHQTKWCEILFKEVTLHVKTWQHLETRWYRTQLSSRRQHFVTRSCQCWCKWHLQPWTRSLPVVLQYDPAVNNKLVSIHFASTNYPLLLNTGNGEFA